MINIRKATEEELDTILQIYTFAKRFMEEHDNPYQWSGADAITANKVREYYSQNILYVGVENDAIVCAFTYLQGEDPTYVKIEDGAWLNTDSYGTLHRLASAGIAHGVVRTVSQWALKQNPNLRIDTHHDNYVMQNALAAAGFQRCGIIYLANGDPRIAYQLH